MQNRLQQNLLRDILTIFDRARLTHTGYKQRNLQVLRINDTAGMKGCQTSPWKVFAISLCTWRCTLLVYAMIISLLKFVGWSIRSLEIGQVLKGVQFWSVFPPLQTYISQRKFLWDTKVMIRKLPDFAVMASIDSGLQGLLCNDIHSVQLAGWALKALFVSCFFPDQQKGWEDVFTGCLCLISQLPRKISSTIPIRKCLVEFLRQHRPSGSDVPVRSGYSSM